MRLAPLEWVVEPNELPIRLVLYRIVEAADGPIHISEIKKVLEDLGVETDEKALMNRLGELSHGPSMDMMIRRVQHGIYVKIGE